MTALPSRGQKEKQKIYKVYDSSKPKLLSVIHALISLCVLVSVSKIKENTYRKCLDFFLKILKVRDHPFKTSACLRGGGVSPCADGQKVTVHKDKKFPS